MKYKPEEEKQLMSDLWSLNIKDNPYNFVKYCFSWEQEDTPLEHFKGPRKWQEKILKDIANEIDMDISTISRVANSKYVDTPYGTKLLKEFFSESMTTTSGEEISTIEIKKILEKIILDENKRKPETDERLVKILNENIFNIICLHVNVYYHFLDAFSEGFRQF